MRNFYSFLTEVEAPGVIDAEASLYNYQRQISQLSWEATRDLGPKIRMSYLTHKNYLGVFSFRIRKGEKIEKFPVDIKYKENSTKGLCYLEGMVIEINSFFFDEENWTNTNFAETLSHELNHAVDYVNGVADKQLTRSKFTKGTEISYWYGNYEFRSLCMAMRMNMESKMRGFTIEGKGVEPEVIVPKLEQYVELAKKDILMGDWRRKRTPEQTSDLMRTRQGERILAMALFGKENYDILMKWWKTPIYKKFVEYMDELSKEWRRDYV